MDVPVELSRILISELGEGQIIVLKETGGERSFPIEIGINEAMAIERRLQGRNMRRPMTHDLLANIVESLGASVESIVISDLKDHTFIATLRLRRGEELIEVDARPSDAIALGVGLDTPLFVADHVLEAVHREPTIEERIELLRRRQQVLSEQIEQLSERLGDDEFIAQLSPEAIAEHRRRLDEMQAEFAAINRLLEKLG